MFRTIEIGYMWPVRCDWHQPNSTITQNFLVFLKVFGRGADYRFLIINAECIKWACQKYSAEKKQRKRKKMITSILI